MPSIISPTGRALQAELQNMPPDQVQAYLNQNVGKVPMAELLAMKMQLDRMRQALPQQQAPQSTVAQDMQAQLQQARGISALPVQNVGQPQNYAGGGIVAFQNRGLVEEETSPFGRWMEAGLGARESRIAQEQLRNRLARDIVSRYHRFAAPEGIFAAQSDVQRQQAQDVIRRLPNMSVEEMQTILSAGPGAVVAQQKAAQDQAALESGRRLTDMVFRQNEAARRAISTPERQERVGLPAALPTPAEEAKPVEQKAFDLAAEIEKERKLREELGIGTTLGEREKYIKEREAKAEKDLADRARMSRAQAFFKMAEESAKPGGTLLKGATAGLSQYAEAKQALADKREQLQDLAKERQFALQEAREQLKLGDYKAAKAAEKEAEKRAEELADKQAEYRQREKEIRLRTEGDITIQRERDAAAIKEAIAKMPQLQILQQQLVAERDPAKRAVLRTQIDELVRQTSAYAAAMDKFNMQQAALGGFGATAPAGFKVLGKE